MHIYFPSYIEDGRYLLDGVFLLTITFIFQLILRSTSNLATSLSGYKYDLFLLFCHFRSNAISTFVQASDWPTWPYTRKSNRHVSVWHALDITRQPAWLVEIIFKYCWCVQGFFFHNRRLKEMHF